MAANHMHGGYHNHVLRGWNSSSSQVTAEHLLYPLFISDVAECLEEIKTLPGQKRIGLDHLADEVTPLVADGLKAILLFGVITDAALKDAYGTVASSEENNPVIRAVKILKEKFPNLLVACDVCLCAYTDHGHCGILKDGIIVPDKSAEAIAHVALAYAKAGADVVAPSDMMDCRIAAIKKKLLEHEKINRVAVMSYSAKFASSFYGPFRDAAQSAPSFGDRKCYQLPPMSRGLAIRATARDVEEGADMIMVKPGMAYLDIVRDLKNQFPHHPLAIYQVSGEYAMLYHGASHGVFDLKTTVMETLGGMRRAGADILISYFTPQVLKWIKEENN